MTKRWLLYIIAIGIVAAIWYGLFLYEGKEEVPVIRDYSEIVESDTLRATMEYNALSLTEGNDSIEGFYQELVQAFARDHGLQLKVTPEMSMARANCSLQAR